MIKKIRISVLLGILLLSFTPIKLAAETLSEIQLKTVYLYNFMRFVDWPEDKIHTPFYQFCIYPNNRFGTLLLQLEQYKIANKSIEVKELSQLADIQSCHVIFIDTVPKADLKKALEIAKNNHVLTISDQSDFAIKGGMIQLFTKKGKIRFNINYISSSLAELEINSKLIDLASSVIREQI